jgi:cytochrome c
MKTLATVAAVAAFIVFFLVANVPAQNKAPISRAQDIFRTKCAACHSIACNRNGPKLEGVIGRQAGAVADYPHYTPELKASGIVWTEQALEDYIADPGKMVPGTSMTSAGKVTSAKERNDIVAHIRRQDRSIDLCP